MLEVVEPVEVQRSALIYLLLGQRPPEACHVGIPVFRAHALENTPFRPPQVGGLQPARCAILDVVEMNRPKRLVDAEPPEECEPATPIVSLERCLVVLVEADLVRAE